MVTSPNKNIRVLHPSGVRSSATANHFLSCLRQAAHISAPFDYWLLDNVLPEEIIHDIASLPFAPPEGAVFDGRRESNNSTRVYFTPENQEKFSVCRETVNTFGDPQVVAALEAMTGADLSRGHLRIEYCQDIDGFWLEPHLDISVKLFTMLVYLSDDPRLFDAGTDIYDASPDHKLVSSAPYERNRGLIFIPGSKTWHGFSRRPILGLRKSVIINYVSAEWSSTSELSYF